MKLPEVVGSDRSCDLYQVRDPPKIEFRPWGHCNWAQHVAIRVEPLPRLLANLVEANLASEAWLFLGQEPTRPVSPKTLGQRLLRHGVNRAARVVVLHHLIGHVHTPLLANLIGYNPNFVADRAATLNTAWANYPALRALRPSRSTGDHLERWLTTGTQATGT